MKKLVIILGLLVAAVAVYGQNEAKETVSVTLNVEGILNRNGAVSINVFNSESSYLKQSFKSMKVDLSEHEGTAFIVDGLPKGEYAISVLHDENKNGELDFGGMGPIEGYGFSNNPDASFGPAPYTKAKLSIEEDTVLTVALN